LLCYKRTQNITDMLRLVIAYRTFVNRVSFVDDNYVLWLFNRKQS